MNLPMEGARKVAPKWVLTITREEDERGLEELLESLQIPIFYQCRGKGTAPSEMLDIFGLSGTTRLITINLVPKCLAEEFLGRLEQRFSLRKRGTGISLTLPITALQSPVLELLQDEAQELQSKERTEQDMAQSQEHGNYVLIWASVASGYADDAVDAARAAGATGGSILKGRRKSGQAASLQLGVCAQEEQEFLLVVVPRAKKQAVMSAIVSACGLASPAHGVVLALPVEDAVGLVEPEGD